MWRQLLMNGLVAGSEYALVALGFSLIYSVSRFFHFSHAAIIVISAYSTYFFIDAIGLPLVFSIALGVVAAALFGAFFESTVYRIIRARGGTSVGLLLASLGIYVAIQNGVSLLFSDNVRLYPGLKGSDPLHFLGMSFTFVQAAIIAINGILYLLIYLLLKRTRTGIMIRAVASEPELALAKGINANRIYLFIMILGSSLAGVAGIMTALDTSLFPTMGFKILLMGVVGAVVGGIGNILGAYVGGLLIGLIQHLSSGVMATQWQDSTVFVLLVLFLLFRPTGIFGFHSGRTEFD